MAFLLILIDVDKYIDLFIMKLPGKYILLMMLALFSSCKYDTIPLDAGSGFIRGEVLDAMTGPTNIATPPLDGAVVETEPPTQKAESNDDGQFYIDNVPPGDYVISADKDGYYTNWKGTEVHTGKVSEVDIHLRPEQEENSPPEEPYSPAPGNGFKIFGDAITLAWEAEDPDGDLIFFDLYFDTSNPPRKIIGGDLFANSYKLDSLGSGETYFWKICVKDWYGASAMGEVWSFSVR